MSTRLYYVGAKRNDLNFVNSAMVLGSGQFYYAVDSSWTGYSATYQFLATGMGQVMLCESPNDQVGGGFNIGTGISVSAAPVIVNSNYAGLMAVSKPLLAPVTISGTLRGQMMWTQSTAASDGFTRVVAYVISRDGRTRRGTLLAGAVGSNEFSLSPTYTNRFCPPVTSVTPVACQAGDRIIVEVGNRISTAGSGKGGSCTFPQGVGDLAVNETENVSSVLLSTNKPWLEFSQDLFFEPQRAAVIGLPLVEPSLGAGGVDVLPPTIDALTPPPGALTPAQPVSFQINDPSGVKFALVYVFYPDLAGKSELVWDGIAFRPEFAGSSLLDAEPDLTQLRFTVLRNGGWPAPPAFEIKAVDGKGNVRT